MPKEIIITLPDELAERLDNYITMSPESLDGFLWEAIEQALDLVEEAEDG